MSYEVALCYEYFYKYPIIWGLEDYMSKRELFSVYKINVYICMIWNVSQWIFSSIFILITAIGQILIKY